MMYPVTPQLASGPFAEAPTAARSAAAGCSSIFSSAGVAGSWFAGVVDTIDCDRAIVRLCSDTDPEEMLSQYPRQTGR